MSGSALCFCLRSLSQTIFHNSRVECHEVVSFTNYGLHTADVAATDVLLLQNYSRPRPRRELLVLHPELALLPRRTAAGAETANMELTNECHSQTWKCRTPVTRELESPTPLSPANLEFFKNEHDFQWLGGQSWLFVAFLRFVSGSEWLRVAFPERSGKATVAHFFPEKWLDSGSWKNIMWLSVARSASTLAFGKTYVAFSCSEWLDRGFWKNVCGFHWLSVARSGSTVAFGKTYVAFSCSEWLDSEWLMEKHNVAFSCSQCLDRGFWKNVCGFQLLGVARQWLSENVMYFSKT